MSTNPRGAGGQGRGRGGRGGGGGGGGRGDGQGGRGGGGAGRGGGGAGRGDGQARGGGGAGRGDGQARGGGGAGRGDGQARGGGGRGGRGDGGRGDGGRGRGGGGRGGPSGRGGPQQLPFRGPPPGTGRPGIYLQDSPVPEPDPRITALEDQLVVVTRDQTFELGDAKFPGRRGYGTLGRRTIMRTNYLNIRTAFEAGVAETTLYRYDVELTPEPSREKCRRVFTSIILQDSRFQNVRWASDYRKLIVTTSEIMQNGTEWKEKTVIPPIDPITEPAGQGQAPTFVEEARDRNRVTFRVVPTGSFTPGHIIQYLRSDRPGASYAAVDDVIQLFNIILAKAPYSNPNIAATTTNCFFPADNHPGMEDFGLQGGLKAMRGYFASVRPAVGRLLLNLNVTSGAFYVQMSLYDLIGQFRTYANPDNAEIEGFLRGLKVRAEYVKDGQSKPFLIRTKTIAGLAPTPQRFGDSKHVKFSYTDSNLPDAEPTAITVFDYFRNRHGITLTLPQLPVLNVGTSGDPQYMPIELCHVLPGQSYKRLLSGPQTSEMLRFAARAPNLNALSITGTPENPGNGVRLFRLRDPGDAQDPQALSVKLFGFSTGVEMITVPARILNKPAVKYGAKSVTPRNGSWNCAGQKFSVGGRFDIWTVLIINGANRPALNEQTSAQLLDSLAEDLGKYGIRLTTRLPTVSMRLQHLNKNNRRENQALLDARFKAAKSHKVQLMFVVLFDADRWLYATIKTLGDVNYGIHTINAVGSKLQKPSGQGMFFGNLALKFNIKGGGVNHIVDSALSRPLDKNTMLMGIDVTHPSPGSKKGAPSIACVVASTDDRLTQFPGSVRTQTGRQEMVDGLEEMVLERIDLWKKRNRSLPTKIILYRDGVSEGQYSQVLNHEVPPFHTAFEKRYGNKPNWPKLAVIVVGKRHHTRFYPTKMEDADWDENKQKGSMNPIPGTVVDRHISGRILREFWLQAHQGLQGTARPAHYVVLRDDVGFEADELEQFTHALCYLFNRAPKAVSICPPAYYADLLCERARCYLFSTLAENDGTGSSVYSAGSDDWTGGVHPDIKDSTFYI